MKIHLKDYTLEERRAIEAGAMCNWLVAQAMGGIVRKFDDCIKVIGDSYPKFVLFWFNGEEEPSARVVNAFSSNDGASFYALKWLMAKCADAGVQSDGLASKQYIAWFHGGNGDQDYTMEYAPTPELAICRAILVYDFHRRGKAGKG